MWRRIKFVPGGIATIRSVGISAVAIALTVYAMVLQERTLSVAIMAAIVVLVATSAMLQVSRAVRKLHREQGEARRAALRAERHYLKVLRRMLAVIEAREPYTRGRSKRIGYMVRRMAEELGLGSDSCQLLELAGQVHDIGLLAVPDCILNKPSRLGDKEFRAVKKHAENSYRILEPLTFLAEVLPAVRYHHERMNGTGYPAGLRGQQIPLCARILAVADAYDAMTHDRPHRPGLPAIEALNELRRCSPAGYDPDCVAALEEVMHMRHLKRAHEASAAPASVPEPVTVRSAAIP